MRSFPDTKSRGRLQEDFLGKRCDFSAYGVIAPEPSLGLGEIGIPHRIISIFTVPQPVAKYNKKFLQDCVKNGPNSSPPNIGAVSILKSGDHFPKPLRGGELGEERETTGENEESREEIARKLRLPSWDKIGGEVRPPDVVHRQLADGDWVVVNKNPSFRKENLLGLRVRVVPGPSFLLNPQSCSPLHADFDGDKVNLFLCQVSTNPLRSLVVPFLSPYSSPLFLWFLLSLTFV